MLVRYGLLSIAFQVLGGRYTEHVESANLQGNRDKAFDQALGKIVDDVKNLVTQPAVDSGK